MPRESSSPNWVFFSISLLIPCFGLFIQRRHLLGIKTLLLGLAVCLSTATIRNYAGPAAGVFSGMLLVFPWWLFQAFQSSCSPPRTLTQTWAIIWQKAHDLRFIGLLFFVAAVTDIWIILGNPHYQLHIFCARPSGALGFLAKLQSPLFHFAIGYGFIRLAQWSFFLYMVYAGYGLLNGAVNWACEGYGRIRTIFMISLLLFTTYIFLRKNCFSSNRGCPGGESHPEF